MGYRPKFEKFKEGNANTAFVNHCNTTYALNEQDLPFKIDITKDSNNFAVNSSGYNDFEGQLNHNVSAHPKVDKKKQELITFGYDVFG